jgi:basic amino acid/polyamine antiporter, APA family
MKEQSRLGVFDLTMIVVSLVIGMGIFKTPVNVAAAAKIPAIFFSAWIIGGLVAFCGALTYAEIGSRYPVTGGYYKIFSYCYHPALGFMINCIILVSNAASTSAVALIGAEYITHSFLPVAMQTGTTEQFIAIGAIAVFFVINLLGLRLSSMTQNILTVVKISMVVILIMAIFTPAARAHHLITPVSDQVDWFSYIRALGVCLIAVSFSYGGYQQTINFGDEVKNANKVIPRAIFFGIVIIIVLYLAINYAYYRVIGFDQLKTANAIAAQLAASLFGVAGGKLFSLLLFISVLAYVNVLLLSNPRVIYAMSTDGILPAFFKKRNQRKQTLVPALTAFTAVCIITLFLTNKFNQLLNYTIFLDSIGMATSAGTIFILRKKTAHLDKTKIYSMKLYPLMPLIFITAYTFVAVSIITSDYQAALYGTLLFAGFFPLYLLSAYFNKKIKNLS